MMHLIADAPVLKTIVSTSPVPFTNRSEFLQECWLVGGAESEADIHGDASEIWKFLTPLIRSLPASGSGVVDAVLRYVDQSAKQPKDYFRELISTQDATFIETLSAMRKVTGATGWLKRVEALWTPRSTIPHADANWMLYLNGKLLRLDLVVDNIFIPSGVVTNQVLTLKQGPTILATRTVAANAKVFFPLADLLTAGMDSTQNITIHLGVSRVDTAEALSATIPVGKPVCFRYPLQSKDYWLPIVSEKAHIYARRVAVMVPSVAGTTHSFSLNGTAVLPTAAETLQVNGKAHNVYVLDFQFISAPVPLTLNGVELLTIGSKPYLEIAGACSDIRCLDHEDAVVVLGGPATVEIKNIPAGLPPPTWTCVGGTVAPTIDTAVTVTPTACGTPVKVKCDTARATLIFLPTSGWTWNPSSIHNEIAHYARQGLEYGILLCGSTISLRITRPLVNVVWWWEKQLSQDPECLKGCKDFNDHGELDAYRLCCWIPNGNVAITLKTGIDITIKTLTGPGFYAERAGELLRGRLTVSAIGSTIDNLILGTETVAQIFRVPNRPTLTMDVATPKVFFPAAGFAPGDYSIICCYESGLASDAIEVIPCSDMTEGTLSPITINHVRKGGEGVWLMLVKDVNITPSLNAICWGQIHIEHTIQWQSPNENYALAIRVGVQGNTSAAGNVRILLDAMSQYGNSLSQYGLFREAINGTDSLDYSSDPNFWRGYFQQHCKVENKELGRTLTLMLRNGYNWAAEPDWLGQAWNTIRDSYKRFTTKRQQEVNCCCRAFSAQQDIQSGAMPYMDGAICDYPTNFLMLKTQGGAPAMQKGVDIRKVGKGHVIVAGLGCRTVAFNYHCRTTISTPLAYGPVEPFRVELAPNAEELYLQKLILNDPGEPDKTCFLVEDDVKALGILFNECLNGAESVIGKKCDRGLAYMFALDSKGFQDMAEEDPTQVNRPLVLQVAVLCRLHAWLGWNSNKYPDGWPLCAASNYNLLCRATKQAWENQKTALISDLIPMEWMLAWFHNYIDREITA